MRIIVALGGNALQKGGSLSAEDQMRACQETAKSVIKLIQHGHNIGIVHGNGPQIGEIMNTVTTAHKSDSSCQMFKFDVCSAFSQGYIGYQLQNALAEALARNAMGKSVATVVTEVEVNKDDPGFVYPTKPIGLFYSEAEAKKIMAASGVVMKEDSGRGWRRVIASPKPIRIIEKDIIKLLFDTGNVVISCGGGGIPVIKGDDFSLTGVEAVIDKDFASAKLGDALNADLLLILTTVEKVSINYNKPNQKELDALSIAEALEYISQKQFAEGSMLPKIEASIEFVRSKPGRKTIITSLAKANDAMAGLTGTTIS